MCAATVLFSFSQCLLTADRTGEIRDPCRWSDPYQSGSPSIFDSVPPRISFLADSGTPHASNMARYCTSTFSTSFGLEAEPNTSFVNALGSLLGVSVPSSVLVHQKFFDNSPS